MAHRYRATGHQAAERAERKRRHADQPLQASLGERLDYAGHGRRWQDGPPPARLRDEAAMERQQPEWKPRA